MGGGLVFAAATACTSPSSRPNVELVMAREAFDDATEIDAGKYAPGYYHKAEQAYHHGLQLYQEQSYGSAIDEFRAARTFAEKAENSARLQRQKSGDEAL